MQRLNSLMEECEKTKMKPGLRQNIIEQVQYADAEFKENKVLKEHFFLFFFGGGGG